MHGQLLTLHQTYFFVGVRILLQQRVVPIAAVEKHVALHAAHICRDQ